MQRSSPLSAWAEGSGTIQFFTVQPTAGERLLLLGTPLLSVSVTLPRCRVSFESPKSLWLIPMTGTTPDALCGTDVVRCCASSQCWWC